MLLSDYDIVLVDLVSTLQTSQAFFSPIFLMVNCPKHLKLTLLAFIIAVKCSQLQQLFFLFYFRDFNWWSAHVWDYQLVFTGIRKILKDY